MAQSQEAIFLIAGTGKILPKGGPFRRLVHFEVKIVPVLTVALNIIFGLETGYNTQDFRGLLYGREGQGKGREETCT